jgi:hypothetical protein
MDEFLAKLTNLSYEFFGVIVPGIVGTLFLGLWWVALGPVAPLWSFEFVPELTLNNAARIIESLSLKAGIGVVVPGLASAYFLGHIILWSSRFGEPDECATKSSWRRVQRSLVFRVPKPPRSFDKNLQSLYDAVQAKFAKGGSALSWEQFYPVVKSYLLKNLTHSLVATYQNKYTLHRSITAAAAGLFWLSTLAVAGGGVTWYLAGVAPRWGLLAMLALLAFVLVLCFSSSYMYYWMLFGNTIITEAYSIIYGPDAQPKK